MALVQDPLLTEELFDYINDTYGKQQQLAASKEGKAFIIKSLNIMDPLLPTNNLGRSVSKANFARIRRAFAHGAKTLEAIMQKVCWNRMC